MVSDSEPTQLMPMGLGVMGGGRVRATPPKRGIVVIPRCTLPGAEGGPAMPLPLAGSDSFQTPSRDK